MGINTPALKLTTTLWKDGHFKGFSSVIEIGGQDLHARLEEAQGILEKIVGSKCPPDTVITPETVYQKMGFTTYKCIDADGSHKSLVFDLNKDIKHAYEFEEQFDLVTNHGTSEHCFSQCSVFQNIHNLCV